jgi:hypothetical protein
MKLEKELLFKSLRDQDRRDRAELEKQKPTRRLGELPGSGKNQKTCQQSTRMTLIGKAVTNGDVGAFPCERALFVRALFVNV